MTGSVRRVVESVRARWSAWRNARGMRGYRIRCTLEALTIEPARGDSVVIPWRTIDRVAVFKRDCYTVDSIRMLIATADGRAYECSEEDEGFDDAVRVLPDRLEGCATFPDWFLKVAFPAFEPNFTQIYPPPEA